MSSLGHDQFNMKVILNEAESRTYLFSKENHAHLVNQKLDEVEDVIRKYRYSALTMPSGIRCKLVLKILEDIGTLRIKTT